MQHNERADETPAEGTPSDELTDAERAVVRSMIKRFGHAKVMALFAVGREPLARAVAGIGARRGTIMLIRAGLARVRDGHGLPAC
jgi:hypothetical protein